MEFFLSALCGEKVCSVAGPEFGEKEGMKMLIKNFVLSKDFGKKILRVSSRLSKKNYFL